MEFGPDEGSSAQPLPEAFRAKFPRSSLRYLLIHHLGLDREVGGTGWDSNWTSTATDCCDMGDMDVGDDLDINDEEEVRAEAIAQEDV